MQAHSLFEGSFSVDSSKKFIPFDASKDNKKDRPGSLFIHVHPFLIESAAGLLLLDTGIGHTLPDGTLQLHNNIRKAGFEPSDIRYVLLSHLHKDHASGMVLEQDGQLRLAFPDAEYVIQRGEWEDAYSGKSDSYKTELFDVLQRSGNLLLIDGDGILNNEVSYEVSGGHTPHHQVFHIRTGGEHYFFGGDEAPEPEQFFRQFAAKYDYDGRKSMTLRQQYFEQGCAEGWVFLMYHSTNIAIGRPEPKETGGYRLVDATGG
ncbi:Metallo-beta-lactamase superfamily protein [Parapedobacter composti]|uniref:Metallo-beta-lactamase superfamily protein n=1 Tax=Parapedobacter composti TaxID=623281 RepID=A0A1I1F142_9SPHI|nr:MBL fold metallo-hydrolase [Parapedobacter composti]SFB92622.1 Metallo-beta-lactamase superfamily protein [Parapedobacter composti]